MFPRDGKTAEEIIRRADVALYRAKSEPGSTLRFFEEEMDVRLSERALIEGELRHAVAGGDIKPHYQPIADLATGRITSASRRSRGGITISWATFRPIASSPWLRTAA